MIGIKHANFHFPGEPLDLIAVPGYSEYVEHNSEIKNFFDQIGIDKIHLSDNDMNAVDLAITAAKQLLVENNISPSSLDLVVYISPRAPDYLMSSETAKVLSALKCEAAFPLCVSDLGCVNISKALSLTTAMIKANKFANALILTGSQPFCKNRFRYPISVIGDGGMALYLSDSDQNLIVDNKISVRGEFWDLFKVDYKNVDHDKWKVDCRDLSDYNFKLALTSLRVFKEMNAAAIENVLSSKLEIKHFLMQNISKGAYDYYEEGLNLSLSPVCASNLSRYGHLGSIDIMLNYFTLINSGFAKKGDHVLIMNNSPVAAWGVTVLKM